MAATMKRLRSTATLSLVISLIAFLGPARARAAQAAPAGPMVIDATAPTIEPGPANYTFDPTDAKSPSGRALGVNSQYLTLDGKPWLPVMGELHYSRVPEAEWETEILKMKSAGVQVIATYLIWIHHEEVEGQWDWAGNKNFRHFVELCAKHGMYVVPRIGPWSHAEVRNGGFPDWLLAKTTQQRSNDPTYLHFVDLYYKQIGDQLKGLMWSQGGPVIAIQLENEYGRHGPLQGPPHILKLKEMARDAGLKVPFYTETGWDNAGIPVGDVLTVDGGYPDAPWDSSIEKLPASGVYAFRLGRRTKTNDMGAIDATPASAATALNTRNTPSMTAEMGGGMQVTYHRRPIVTPDDIDAMMPVALGNGVNLYGTYMFHGGENPDGKLTTLQESLATHYANDLPVKSYDFQAPIGEFGDERPSLLKLKSWNYFLNDFGPILAPMQPRRPDTGPVDTNDFTVPRIMARTSGNSGFLFVNNHVREYPMPAHPNFQVTIKLPAGESLTLPSKPVTLPADAYFVWPFHMDLSGLHLRFATAQPLAILGTKDAPVYAFFAQPNIPAEFVIDDTPGLKVRASQSGLEIVHRNGTITLSPPSSWLRGGTTFTLANGKSVTILLIHQQTAEDGWKIQNSGDTELLVTGEQTFINGNVATLQNLTDGTFTADLIPGNGNLVSLNPAAHLMPLPDGGYGASYRTAYTKLTATQTKPAGDPAPLPANFKPSDRPRSVAAAPTDADFARAAVYSIPLPKSALTDTPTEQHFLRIHYTGDVARLSTSADGKPHLLDDNFADGRPWLVGLTRFDTQLQRDPNLQLSIYPLRANAPIFFEPGFAPKVDGSKTVSLESVELLTQYTLKLKLETHTSPRP
jgi:beta-galactosidase